MGKHALLSASSSKRWLACPPSARKCSEAEERASPYALEGTDAHRLCEYKVLKSLGRDEKDPTEELEYYNSEMENATEEYCQFVLQQMEEAREHCKDPRTLIEERLDFSRWVPQGFGTGDCLIIADDVLHIIDYKHGEGVLVEADHNTQMMCYALGALDLYDGIYDIKEVKMTIFQPRRDNVSTFTMSAKDLYEWADTVLAPTAQLAFKGEGEYKAGDHCQFCKIKATCRARADYNLELAKYDFRPPAELDDSEIADILPRLESLTSWASDIRDYALKEALNGTKFDGYKLVEGRAVRKYSNDKAVADIVSAAGYDPFERKLLGITAMTSMLGKQKFNELLGDYIVKPQGKPSLVPESDKRQELNSAIEDFKEK